MVPSGLYARLCHAFSSYYYYDNKIRVSLVLLQKLIFIVSCDVCYLSFILA